jgi:hypothetical protein
MASIWETRIMSNCKNCGHDSHCGVSLKKDHRRKPYNHGIEGQIEICKKCVCPKCEIKT